MDRTGELMHRESLISDQRARHHTCEMARVIGEALEDISKATGAVAHLYKNFEVGPTPG